jgi:uncharacterized membrane protein
MPIGILLMSVVLHFLGYWSRYAAWRGLLPVLWFAGAVTAVLACGAGFLLKAGGGYEADAVAAHQYAGLALAAVAIVVLLAHRRAWAPHLQTGAVTALALLLFATGHYGGNLTHGEDYLSQPLYAMAGSPPQKTARKPIANIREALVYRDLVEPVLEQKCWQCHGPRKQKGKLRLDTEHYFRQGGENGQIVVAGNADKSDLYKRLVLPAGHDDRMPPKGKPQLTDDERQLIYWWISQGQADFTKKVSQVTQDDETMVLLASRGAGSAAAPAPGRPSEIPAVKVGRPDPVVLRELAALGAAITPLTPDHVFLAVNLGNAPHFTDAHMALLQKLHNQVLWLDLAETAITDKALAGIARFSHLTRLKLDNTRITDAGIAHIKSLTQLRALNLYGTQVSDRSVPVLQACKKLESLYLWRTRVTAPGVAALQQALGPQVEINFGSMADKPGNL